MTAVLSFDLKKGLHHLTVDDRWSVLTVFILHANTRNRCYPTMQTVARMGANGNLKRATEAKKWLVECGALRLVPYDKRVDDEVKLPRRQHVYQLTGRFVAEGITYAYLYIRDEIIDAENFSPENFDGEKQSISIVSKPSKKKNIVADKPQRVNPYIAKSWQAQNPDATLEEVEAVRRQAIDEQVQRTQERMDWNADWDAMVEAVKVLPGVSGKVALQYAHMLRGTAKKGEYAEWCIADGLWSHEFKTYLTWYKRKYPTQQIVKTTSTLHGYIMEWIDAGKPDTSKPKSAASNGSHAAPAPADEPAPLADFMVYDDDGQYVAMYSELQTEGGDV